MAQKDDYASQAFRVSLIQMFILHRLKERPSSGYDLISYINTVTHGSWKPGSASIYPTLRKLEKDGLIRTTGSGPRSKRIYSITDKGLKQLEKMKSEFDSYSVERWHRIRGMMLFVVNPRSLARMLNETIEMQKEAWERIISSDELETREKTFFLEEHKLLLENHLEWVKDKIKSLRRS
jgi:DNA-binding PadR family transcriptional regulator